ncbi:hypothetical protein AVDCRST_MAG92-228, partial [uncultured Coleofasciculus sp.]
ESSFEQKIDSRRIRISVAHSVSFDSTDEQYKCDRYLLFQLEFGALRTGVLSLKPPNCQPSPGFIGLL